MEWWPDLCLRFHDPKEGDVVDARVRMKWLVTEDYSDEAVGPLSGAATFVAPALVFAETVDAI